MINKTINSKNKSKQNKDFSTLFSSVSAALEKSEIQACHENGITRNRYQSIFNRIFMVKTYIDYKNMHDYLISYIQKDCLNYMNS